MDGSTTPHQQGRQQRAQAESDRARAAAIAQRATELRQRRDPHNRQMGIWPNGWGHPRLLVNEHQRRNQEQRPEILKHRHQAISQLGVASTLDTECSICQEESDSHVDSLALVLPRGHKFGTVCITTWLLDHTTCPLCRREYRILRGENGARMLADWVSLEKSYMHQAAEMSV